MPSKKLNMFIRFYKSNRIPQKVKNKLVLEPINTSFELTEINLVKILVIRSLGRY